MLKTLLFAFTAFALINSQNLEAQNFITPDYSSIESESTNPESDLNFTKLFSDFQNSKKVFTLKEKQFLYFGWIYQSDYNPYLHSPFEDSISNVFKNNSNKESEYFDIIRFGDEILKVKPFHLQTMHHQSFAYQTLGMLDKVNELIRQMSIIYDAIYSTGNGHSKQKAIHVIYLEHETEVVSTYGLFKDGNLKFEDEKYDIVGLKKNDNGIDKLYFNIEQILSCSPK